MSETQWNNRSFTIPFLKSQIENDCENIWSLERVVANRKKTFIFSGEKQYESHVILNVATEKANFPPKSGNMEHVKHINEW